MVVSCSKTTDKQTTVNKIDSTTTDYYSASEIYREADSDSLIIKTTDLVNLIKLFKQSGDIVSAKEYGAGDYYGKFKVFSYSGDTLVIDKNDSGEYGFGNSQYLIKKGSLTLVRKYILESDYGNNKHSIKESIFNFDNASVTILERSKTITELNDFGFKGIPFDTLADSPINHGQLFRQELTELLKRELMVD
jgi:hypothetical protein